MFGKRPNGSVPPPLSPSGCPRHRVRPRHHRRSPPPRLQRRPPPALPKADALRFRPRASGRQFSERRRRRKRTPAQQSPPQQVPSAIDTRRSDTYYETKGTIFGALIEAIDLGQLAKLDADSAREEIRDIVNEIIAIKNIVMSISEQEDLLDDICNDVLGYGPLEPLLARDEISDIMVNGSGTVYIEVGGKIQKTGIRFRDNQQLLNICQRIVSQVGRRVDESSPICDARLAGRLARQRDRAAARDRRPGAHDPQIQEGQAHARAARSGSARSRRKGRKSSRSSAAAA